MTDSPEVVQDALTAAQDRLTVDRELDSTPGGPFLDVSQVALFAARDLQERVESLENMLNTGGDGDGDGDDSDVLARVERLEALLHALGGEPGTVVPHETLAQALSAFQAEVPVIKKRKTATVKMAKEKGGGSYQYKYADLGDIIAAVGPLMGRHGLSWSAKSADAGGKMVLRYTLRHTSGETDEGETPLGIPASHKPQDLGSAMSYMRRYAMGAQLNIATEEDDDAQVAQNSEHSPASEPAAPAAPREPERVSQDGMDRIRAAAAIAGLTHDALANVIKQTLRPGSEPLDITEEEAARWVDRWLPQIYAHEVRAILANIAKETPVLTVSDVPLEDDRPPIDERDAPSDEEDREPPEPEREPDAAARMLAADCARVLAYADAADIAGEQLANLIRLAAGGSPGSFDSPAAAQAWIDHWLPSTGPGRLEARLVAPILASIENAVKVNAAPEATPTAASTEEIDREADR